MKIKPQAQKQPETLPTIKDKVTISIKDAMIIGHSVMSGAGIKQLLKNIHPECESSFFYPSQALRAVKDTPPQCIIIDTTTRSRDYFAIARTLKKIPILLVVSSDSPADALPLLRVGATGIVDDQCDPAEFRLALESCMQGQVYVPERYCRSLLVASLRKEGAVIEGKKLSKTQVRIVELVAKGLSVADIAQETGLQAASIHVYLCRIRKELGLSSQRQLERYLAENPSITGMMHD